MTKLLFWTCIVTSFLTALIQAELLSKRQKTRPMPSCKTLKCPSDRICSHKTVSPVCAVFEGKPCSSNDICEGGYYCPDSKVCNGSAGLPQGAKCERNECGPGLYCDNKLKKCLRTNI
jgi:hypothetical protein